MNIYLASKSPRRQELLMQMGIEFEIIDGEINEHWNGDEHPHEYVKRLALEKARYGFNSLEPGNDDGLVIGADTSVVLDDTILGKAVTPEHAAAMLRELSGRRHEVYSAVAIVKGDRQLVKTSISHVSFKPLSVNEIVNYCETDEPLGKAGGYAIQGRAAIFIERLEGSYSGVMGLPIFETSTLLNQFFRQNP
ncbi:MAG: septum formation inhibitor Maf [Gammaproteobacteria bacterium]|nr:septum formation inhibitor Maf [Gammaproteobacteria bacterium]NIN61702.1 septum formation inhibitor Maf [Gammaproteobacteria bacterium]NIO63499.1 septum formation inhibitor Maf [Gammaproteobacteria bacterium]NIP48719.1 septum formation inhibitor Maf [Gammaproteobacteria bacterium]NIQ09171.1 septum formation inhibitor Maf [Gammaproteobacteria bacterium]